MDFDAIVIGGGHAGIEAALALPRLGFSTLLITQSLDSIGRLSCNPAVGGLSKGNIVREIDALGGEMGRLIDASMIQFRILNRRRGPAVQAPRAQADKYLYSMLARRTLERQTNLEMFQDTVVDLILDGTGSCVRGVATERGRRFSAPAVILTTGTFMEASIFIGEYTAPSGRLGEPAACGLGRALRRLGFSVGRLKTGTPARVARSSLDFGEMELQEGDSVMLPFSFGNEKVRRPSVPCYITYTNERTHAVIRANIHRSPLYGGKIVGRGPRYCPSIEDKVVRFPDRERHQIFVEPEGYGSEEMYLNGISSSLPEEVQEEFFRTIPGLRKVRVMRPGYAVEYDYLDPIQLNPSLMTKRLAGLFIAGQTNGTSGYEEAACQGLMAGINAAMLLQNRPPVILSRAEAYTGVLIDDLTTQGTTEPYRMFTSRAEYRLQLRHDNADMRLHEKALSIGLLGETFRLGIERKMNGLNNIREILRSRRVSGERFPTGTDFGSHTGKSYEQLLKIPEVSIDDIMTLLPELADYPAAWLQQAELDIKYDGYIKRQEIQIGRFERLEKMRIPGNFDYKAVGEISMEAREKLSTVRPLSIGQASRVPGVRNSDIAVLMVLLKKDRDEDA